MDRGNADEAADKLSRLDINNDELRKGSDSSQPDESDCSNNKKIVFNKLVLSGKELARKGQLEEALQQFLEAYEIHESPKLLKRINKLKEVIKEYEEAQDEEDEEEEEEDDDGLVDMGNGFRLATEISAALYPYQKEGLMWFWGLYKKKQGGILGDDMGLGKTIQVIAFLAGMFDLEKIKTALIVMPVSLMENWSAEFKKWAPGIRVRLFHGSNKKERQRNLDKIQHKSGVCLTTYGLVVSSHETLSKTHTGRPFEWDYILLDEGHKIKNPTKTSKNVRAIPAKHHFILTGTPIQNNLREMWALFDFTCQGQLLGSARTFKQEYDNPITRARERDASAYEKRIGGEMAESLRQLIEPHFLRRTKAMVLKSKDGGNTKKDGAAEEETSSVDGKVSLPKTPSSKMPESLMRKNDLIVWLKMSKTQLKIYVDFLGLERVKEMLMSTRSPLAELNVLKKICDHPRLLSAMACTQLGLDEEARAVNIDDDDKENMGVPDNYGSGSGGGPSDATLMQESGKMVFVLALLDNLKDEGHRCLLFSQSRKMLDIIQRIITHRGHKVLRIDGTITSTAERQHLINTFQKNPSYTCFLLTTQVGGVGITLTAADRVVIFDPSWNPATDAQAVDRAYRIGQKKCVVIYRLITCGSIEEKIYRKQIFKDALMKQATGSSKNPFRYFSSQDLRDLFTLDDPSKSKTQQQLATLHASHRKSDATLDKHIEFLHSLDHVFGITDHDLMYSQEAVETAEELAESGPADAIQARVLRAQNMVAAESSAGGQHNPYNPQPASYENPRQNLHSRTPKAAPKQAEIDDMMEKFNRKAVQSKLPYHVEVFQPTRKDTKRFMPGNFVKKPPAPPFQRNEVIDLSTPPTTPEAPRTPPEERGGSVIDLTLQVNADDLETSFAGLGLEDDASRGNESSQKSNAVAEAEESFASAVPDVSCSSNAVPDMSCSIDAVPDISGSIDAVPDMSGSIDANAVEEELFTSAVHDITGSSDAAAIEDSFKSAVPDISGSELITSDNVYGESATETDSRHGTPGMSDSTASLGQSNGRNPLDAECPLANSTLLPTFEAVFDDRMFPSIDLANSPARTPRRRSMKNKRRSVSQMPFNNIDDSDDDSRDQSENVNERDDSRDQSENVNERDDSRDQSEDVNDRDEDDEEISITRKTKNKNRIIESSDEENDDDESHVASSSIESTANQENRLTRNATVDSVDEGRMDGYNISDASLPMSLGERSAVDSSDVMVTDGSYEHRDEERPLYNTSEASASLGERSAVDASDVMATDGNDHYRDEERPLSNVSDASFPVSADSSDVLESDDRYLERSKSSASNSNVSNDEVISEGGSTEQPEDNTNEKVGDEIADSKPEPLPIQHLSIYETVGGLPDESVASSASESLPSSPSKSIDDDEEREEASESLPSSPSKSIDEEEEASESLPSSPSKSIGEEVEEEELESEEEDGKLEIEEQRGKGLAESDEEGEKEREQELEEERQEEEELEESSEESPSDAEEIASDDTEDTASEDDISEEFKPVKNKPRVRRIDTSDESDANSEPSRDTHSPNERDIKKYCCPTGKHQSDVVRIAQCACVLSPEEKEQCAEHQRLGARYENEGNITFALDHYTQSLELDEGDLALHKKVLLLCKEHGKLDRL